MNEFDIIDELIKLNILDKANSTTSTLYLELNDIGYIGKNKENGKYLFSDFDGCVRIYFNKLFVTDNGKILFFNNSNIVGEIECV